MKVEHINPFISAIKEVLNENFGMGMVAKKPFLKEYPAKLSDLIIMIGITGKLRGQVIFNMKESMGKMIASKMMMGMPVDKIDDMAESAISEMGNMVMGHVATNFSKDGMIIDITPPTLLIGSGVLVNSISKRALCIPFECPKGEQIQLDIAFEN